MAAAVDDRVVAIAPIVMDLLNLVKVRDLLSKTHQLSPHIRIHSFVYTK